ncbi:MAG: glutamine-hydrolyzing GMP synthase [Elusimicrobiota bacterium]|nr:glutamine-hydrolyzing GMP synthase [Elusimicrobiota bacterium]
MILILDFGSQYTQLIARLIRELGVYCEIHPYNFSIQNSKLKNKNVTGIILSGGPASVYEKDAPRCDKQIYQLDVPILGICYGMQLLVHDLGGKVEKSTTREYGFAQLKIEKENHIFSGILRNYPITQSPNHLITVWMSHGDIVKSLPEGFITLGQTENCKFAAIASTRRKIYGLQFHPEVKHTQFGKEIIKNFLKICNATFDWPMKNFLSEKSKEIKELVGKERVILALSGGVDSSVTAMLLYRTIGKQLTCVFVDNGLLRIGERERVERIFKPLLGKQLMIVDAKMRFLRSLKGITDSEEKRKIIGREFIRIFNQVAKSENVNPTVVRGARIKFLAQGTLYPDWIESTPVKGPSAKIKSHHNVGGLPKRMKLELIEPLKYLFKDEVRKLGRELGLPEEIITQQPFPGPGLAVRIIGEVTEERLRILRQADKIVQEEINSPDIWQAFAIFLPVKSVGIMGDKRTYENVIALRVVESRDAMTADWVRLPYETLNKISNRIINEVKGVNRVVYDISSKPPATIEWE